jgi:hypothetical protein
MWKTHDIFPFAQWPTNADNAGFSTSQKKQLPETSGDIFQASMHIFFSLCLRLGKNAVQVSPGAWWIHFWPVGPRFQRKKHMTYYTTILMNCTVWIIIWFLGMKLENKTYLKPSTSHSRSEDNEIRHIINIRKHAPPKKTHIIPYHSPIFRLFVAHSPKCNKHHKVQWHLGISRHIIFFVWKFWFPHSIHWWIIIFPPPFSKPHLFLDSQPRSHDRRAGHFI